MRVVFFVLVSVHVLFGQEAIGKVIGIEGNVRVDDRVLEKGSPIYVEDTIVVGAASRVQIRFTDNSLLNLASNSEYRVNAYSYRQKSKPDRYLAELFKGGFRSLSGSIAKKNPQEYEVKTPTSTIGLRGTIITVSIIRGIVYYGCEKGKAVVYNQVGSILIGTDEPTQFCFVSSPSSNPEALEIRPYELRLNQFEGLSGGLRFNQVPPAPTQQPREREHHRGPGGPYLQEQGSEEGEEWKFHQEGGGASINSGC